MSTYGNPIFMSIGVAPSKPNWRSFAASYVMQIIALVALLCFTIVSPRIVAPVATHVELVAPDLTPHAKPAPRRPMVQELARLEAPKIVLPVAPAKFEAPVLQPQRVQRLTKPAEMAQPQIAIAPKFDANALTALPKTPAKIIATNTFANSAPATPAKAPARTVATNSFGSSAPQTLQNIAPNKVQTGGFGDPNGVPASAHGSAKSIISAAGSFDLPVGAGYGNGSGGSKGVRGTVASTGFGNGIATQGSSQRSSQAHVQATSFVTVTVPAPTPEERRATTHPVASAPVSIQSKPTPVYTPEARQLRVEGEVVLNVVFSANGQIHIVNVLHGLGHGLDEAAQRAAQGVRFSPATRDGQPVDSHAILHIVFQLS
jgi:TonB family protein